MSLHVCDVCGGLYVEGNEGGNFAGKPCYCRRPVLIGNSSAMEIADLKKTLEAVEHEVAKVYCHITNNKFSKANTIAQFVIDEADEMYGKEIIDLKAKLEAADRAFKHLDETAQELLKEGEEKQASGMQWATSLIRDWMQDSVDPLYRKI